MRDWAAEVRRRLPATLQLAPGREAEIVEELAQDLEDRWRELVAGGMAPEAAARATLDGFRDDLLVPRLAALRQARQDVPPPPGAPATRLFADLRQDLRYAARMLRRQPGFALLAIVTLALGIGASSATISLVRALFLAPLPVEDASRLVVLHQTLAHRREALAFEISLPDYWHYRAQTRTLSELAAQYPAAPMHLATESQSRAASAELVGAVVSANYFSALRLQPQLGRFFLPREDEVPDRDAVAVIGDDLWRRQFDADPGILGHTIALNGRAFSIVGVAPRRFLGAVPGLARADVWIPTAMFHAGYQFCDAFRADCRVLQLLGRLAPGETVATAQAEMDVLAAQLVATSRDVHEGRGILVRQARGVRLNEQAAHAPTVRLLLAIAIAVLFTACVNLAGLLLARNVARRKEVAIRLALGAGARRMLRQFLIESLLLALLGGTAGVFVAGWTNGLLRASFSIPDGAIATNFFVPIDGTVLGLTLALSIGTALVFGIVPAWSALDVDVVPAVKDDTAAGGYVRSRLHNALVVVQIAASVVLLTGAGLLARSLAAVLQGPGYDIERVLLTRVRPGQVGYKPEAARQYHLEAIGRLASLPGVASVSIAQFPPLPGWGPTPAVSRPGDPTPAARASFNRIGARYFETLGIGLVAGRDFTDRDGRDAPPAAVVNETLAGRLFGSGRAVGEPLVVDGVTYDIIGVAEDAQFVRAGEPPAPAFYACFWQVPSTHRQMGDGTIHVRVQRDAPGIVGRVREQLAAIDRNVPIAASTLSARVDESFRNVRLARTLVSYAAVLALFLSAIGVYGLLSYAVNQRRRELAIRAALGAERRALARLILTQSARLAASGMTAGVMASLAAVRLLASVLYGVRPHDPAMLAAACAVIAAAAVAATWLPVRRAASVDPNVELRSM